MLSVLPTEIAQVYRDPRRAFRPEIELPKVLKELCQRYSRFGGPWTEWVKYLNRPVAQELWHLAPESAAVATTSVARVPKKAGQGLRHILQSIPLNEVLRELEELLSRGISTTGWSAEQHWGS